MSSLYDRTPFDTPSITTLPPAAECELSPEQRAAALAWLTAHDGLDCAAMLGLTEEEDQ